MFGAGSDGDRCGELLWVVRAMTSSSFVGLGVRSLGAGEEDCEKVGEAADAGGGEVDGVVVAHDRVDADGGAEADAAGESEGLPQIERGVCAAGAGEDQEADVEHSSAKAGAIVSDEGNQAGI